MARLVTLLACSVPLTVFAQGRYSVDSIPKELKQNADAVIRLDETVFTIRDIDNAIEKRHLVVTIFNQSGEDLLGTYTVNDDGYTRVRSLEGSQYDASGATIGKLKKKDIRDYFPDAYDKSVTDKKMKEASFDSKGSVFPYTVEFTSELSESNMMFYPMWMPTRHEHTGIQKASLAIVAPSSYAFRIRESNMPAAAQVTREGNIKTTKWTVEHISPASDESYVSWNGLPTVLTAPVNFEVEGYRGSIKTWADVGKFYSSLLQGLDELPSQAKQKIRDLVAGETDPRKKTEIVYKYLQANTRYTYIELGFGGWKPMPATEVATKGYGDCKALSNYMVAMLKEAGIKAYPALINSGNDHFENDDFPALWFNHLIVCVPMAHDSVWLECTSQTAPLGYQGSFTGNRHALLITPDGGAVVRTTAYSSSDNLRQRTINASVDDRGAARVTIKTRYTGLRQEPYNGIYNQLNREKQKQYILKHLPVSNFELNNFSLKEIPRQLPEMEESLDLSVGQLMAKSGQRIILRPNLVSRFFETDQADEARKAPLYLNPNVFTKEDIDTVVYSLPPSYQPESMPPPVALHSRFGDYACSYTFKEGQLTYYRRVTITGGTFPPEAYKEWIDFARKIRKYDNTSVVFNLSK